MGDVISHPLFLLLAGTVLTGVLLPFVAIRRDRAARATEVKVRLVEQLTVEVTARVMAFQFDEVARDASQRQAMNEAYRRFAIQSELLAARIDAYLGDTGLGERWKELSKWLVRFYAQQGIQDPAEREAALAELAGKFGTEAAWGEIRDGLRAAARQLARDILAARVTALKDPGGAG